MIIVLKALSFFQVIQTFQLLEKLFSCALPLGRTAAWRREEIKECFTNVKQVFLVEQQPEEEKK